MNVLVSASARFVVTEDGELWSANSSLDYRFWTRYLDVFDEVRLLVRAAPRPAPPSGWSRVTGARVKGVYVPDFRSLGELARDYRGVMKTIRSVLSEAPAVDLRLPCPVGELIWRSVGARPYGVEIVGDPYDSFSPGAVRHPLRALFRWWFPRQLRRQCAEACAATYVTERALQSRYPSLPSAFSTHYSSVELSDSAFVSASRKGSAGGCPTRLITVGSLGHWYKAADVLTNAVAACVREGVDLELSLIGDGKHRVELEARVAAGGLSPRVHFLGQVSDREILRERLGHADLFVLPSRQEGLPRAMIEAMAQGLPCIGSNVGGIPELLSAEDLVPPNDVGALAAKIREVVGDRERLARMSARNLEKAREYRTDALRARRVDFYRYLRTKTEEWLAHRQTTGANQFVGQCSEEKVT